MLDFHGRFGISRLDPHMEDQNTANNLYVFEVFYM